THPAAARARGRSRWSSCQSKSAGNTPRQTTRCLLIARSLLQKQTAPEGATMLKTGTHQLRDAEQEPPRSDGVVPLRGKALCVLGGIISAPPPTALPSGFACCFHSPTPSRSARRHNASPSPCS